MTKPRSRELPAVTHRLLSLLAVLAWFVWTAGATAQAEETFPPFEESSHNGAFLVMDRGLPILHLYGEPYERGFQAGKILKEQIDFLIDHYVSQFVEEKKREDVLTVVYGLEPRIPEYLRDEMHGMADGAERDYADILLANSFVDLFAVGGCSTVTVGASRSSSGKLLLARNLDWPALGIVDQADIIVVYHPSEGPAVVSVTWPGMVGVVSGFNDRGLAAAMLVSLAEPPRLVGMPNVLAYRKLLDTVESVEGVDAFFDEHTTIAPSNLAVADSSGDSLVMELDPYWGNVPRDPEDEALVCTNWFVSQPQIEQDMDWRYGALKELITGQERHSFMDLRRYLQRVAPRSGALDNLQAMIFEPESGLIYLSAQTLPAADGRFLRFDAAALTKVPPQPTEAEEGTESSAQPVDPAGQ